MDWLGYLKVPEDSRITGLSHHCALVGPFLGTQCASRPIPMNLSLLPPTTLWHVLVQADDFRETTRSSQPKLARSHCQIHPYTHFPIRQPQLSIPPSPSPANLIPTTTQTWLVTWPLRVGLEQSLNPALERLASDSRDFLKLRSTRRAPALKAPDIALAANQPSPSSDPTATAISRRLIPLLQDC